VAPADALGCVASDRVTGMLALAVLVTFTQFGLIDSVAEPRVRHAIWIAIGLVVCAVLAALFVGRILDRCNRGLIFSKLSQSVGHLKTIVSHPRSFAAVLLAAIAGHCAIVMMFFLLSIGLGVSISAAEAITFFPTVFLLSMMPLTIAGWGVREAVVITALKLLGVPPTASIALGISFGVCMLAVGIPGALLWMIDRRHAR
jgi:uncharacterized membrane protein YbhN (UPF0104 family)